MKHITLTVTDIDGKEVTLIVTSKEAKRLYGLIEEVIAIEEITLPQAIEMLEERGKTKTQATKVWAALLRSGMFETTCVVCGIQKRYCTHFREIRFTIADLLANSKRFSAEAETGDVWNVGPATTDDAKLFIELLRNKRTP